MAMYDVDPNYVIDGALATLRETVEQVDQEDAAAALPKIDAIRAAYAKEAKVGDAQKGAEAQLRAQLDTERAKRKEAEEAAKQAQALADELRKALDKLKAEHAAALKAKAVVAEAAPPRMERRGSSLNQPEQPAPAPRGPSKDFLKSIAVSAKKMAAKPSEGEDDDDDAELDVRRAETDPGTLDAAALRRRDANRRKRAAAKLRRAAHTAAVVHVVSTSAKSVLPPTPSPPPP